MANDRRARSAEMRVVTLGMSMRGVHGELRETGYVPIERHLYCVVFTQRCETFRVISLRRANSRKVKRYGQQT